MTEWKDRTELKDRTISNFIKGVKTLWSLLGDTKKSILLIVGMTIFAEATSLIVPYLLKLVFDELPRAITEQSISSYILILIFGIIAVEIFHLFFVFKIREPLTVKSVVKLENWWPVLMQEKLLALSFGYHEKENTGKKISKITKGCDKLVDLVARLFWSFLPQFLYLALNVIILMIIDWKLGLLFFAPFIPAALIYQRCYRIVDPIWREYEEKKEISLGLFCQSLVNIATVQDFVQEKKENRNLLDVHKKMGSVDVKGSLKMQDYYFWIHGIVQLFLLITIIAGIYFVFKGTSTIGTIVYVVAVSNATMRCLLQLVKTYSNIMRNMVAVQRMKDIFDEEIDIKNSPDALIPQEYIGSFALDRLSFAYHHEKASVLDNLSIRIRPGEMIALVGKSGSGKTTLIRLLCRMYDIDKGTIMLDGSDIRRLDLYWYRRLFSIVKQDIDIFDDTLLANITYAYPNASEKQVFEAIEAAHLGVVLEDENRFPEGLETQLGERGVKLSGGERQRVGIARAYISLLNGARVLILDEATSSLDSEAEIAIQGMIDKLRKTLNISVVAIAHRLSTVHRANRIYVLDDGKVVEQGSHQELLSQEGHYHNLVELQRFGSS